MNKILEEFNKILKRLLDTNDNMLLIELFNYYNKNKDEIRSLYLLNKNNIININDKEFNLSETMIISLDSYKKVVTKYCNFIENFFVSNEEINEINIKTIIIDIIQFLNMKENIMDYIIDIPEHSEFFYKNGLHFYNENLILESCIKRTKNESLYKILVKNLVYYKIKNDIQYDISID